jgi:hypothetical protein
MIKKIKDRKFVFPAINMIQTSRFWNIISDCIPFIEYIPLIFFHFSVLLDGVCILTKTALQTRRILVPSMDYGETGRLSSKLQNITLHVSSHGEGK